MGQLKNNLIAGFAIALLSAASAYAQVGQVIAGKEGGTGQARTVNVDSLGRVAVVGAAAGGSVYGVDANNTVPTQPGVGINCMYNAVLPSVTSGRVYFVQCDSNGRLLTSPVSVQAVSQSGAWTVAATQSGVWNVGVTGTVAATQSGAWNVGQTGTWTVQPGNTQNTTPWLVQSQGSGGALSNGLVNQTSAGGAAVTVFNANASRKYLMCQNPSSSFGEMWINFGATATNAPPSFRLDQGASIVFESNFIPTGSVSMISTFANNPFTCKEG